jgi:multiple sugar transport system permease protein
MKIRHKIDITPYLMLLPIMVFICTVLVYPILAGIITAFYNMVLTRPQDIGFIGFGNFSKIFEDHVIVLTIKNTFLLVSLSVSLQLLCGLIISLLLNRKFVGRNIYLAVVFCPWAISMTLAGIIFRWMFHQNLGVINDFLLSVGVLGEPLAWLAKPATAMVALITVNVWKGIPFFALMILAGLQAIPESFYEVADIEGAGFFQKFFRITLPAIKQILLITVILRIIWTFNTVDLIFVLTNGGPMYATETVASYIFKLAYSTLDFGYASALSILLLLFLMGFTLIYFRISKLERL